MLCSSSAKWFCSAVKVTSASELGQGSRFSFGNFFDKVLIRLVLSCVRLRSSVMKGRDGGILVVDDEPAQSFNLEARFFSTVGIRCDRSGFSRKKALGLLKNHFRCGDHRYTDAGGTTDTHCVGI